MSIDRWDRSSRYPEGHFVRSLGETESKSAEQESLLLEYDVPYRPFGKSILACLPKEGDTWVVPPKDNDPRGDWRGREDLRDVIICSIDPPGPSSSPAHPALLPVPRERSRICPHPTTHRLPGHRRRAPRPAATERQHRGWCP